MSTSTSTEATQVKLFNTNKPELTIGKYQITFTQEIAGGTIPADTTTNLTKDFYVTSERFNLPPEAVHNVFPPASSTGDHSDVLPHVVLNRNTLPWERSVHADSPDSNDIPWLALLLIDESEFTQDKANNEDKVTIDIVNLSDIKDSLKLDLEPGQSLNDQIQVVDVPKDLLQKILPTTGELKLLTHVRETEGQKKAFVISNRLPQKNKQSYVYLVSLENRFQGDSFNYGNAKKIRLVVLKHWSFSCLQHYRINPARLDKAYFSESGFKQSVIKNFADQDFFGSQVLKKALQEKSITFSDDDFNKLLEVCAYGDFKKIIQHLNHNPGTLRLPEITVKKEKTEPYLAKGFVPLPHFLRGGSRSVSWYHGPFTPGTTEIRQADLSLPARGADELVIYSPKDGMFDMSYAAAWELGRILALQDKAFSTALYQYKRTYAQQKHIELQSGQSRLSHLPNEFQRVVTQELPLDIKQWLDNMTSLKGVPFNYLIPNENLLPVESIRFFYLDQTWVNCLLDGALSLGRSTDKDHQHDNRWMQEETVLLDENINITGALLRSEVVSGWKDLEIDALASGNEALSPRRFERLSANVLLCLFAGELTEADIYLKPEALHFGLTEQDVNTYVREREGKDSVAVELKDKRKIDIAKLAAKLTPEDSASSAKFAEQMVVKTDRMRFRFQDS